jgi:hypothetical protein
MAEEARLGEMDGAIVGLSTHTFGDRLLAGRKRRQRMMRRKLVGRRRERRRSWLLGVESPTE